MYLSVDLGSVWLKFVSVERCEAHSFFESALSKLASQIARAESENMMLEEMFLDTEFKIHAIRMWLLGIQIGRDLQSAW